MKTSYGFWKVLEIQCGTCIVETAIIKKTAKQTVISQLDRQPFHLFVECLFATGNCNAAKKTENKRV